MADEGRKIPWYSWIILALHLTWSVGLLWMTKSELAPSEARWGILAAFVLGALVLGGYDFLINKNVEGRDATPFDIWTIIHTLAGVVFGIWYVPLIFVLITVIWWEAFEFSVTGFGEKEVILNRVVDVGVALAGWLVVVVILLIAKGADFPFASPVPA